jgi:hypothetical protein
MMFTYCRALDHSIQDYPQLVVKWHVRGNKNLNTNQNVQMILVERPNEGPREFVVTHRGARIGIDRIDEGKWMEKWVKPFVGSIPTFDPQQ